MLLKAILPGRMGADGFPYISKPLRLLLAALRAAVAGEKEVIYAWGNTLPDGVFQCGAGTGVAWDGASVGRTTRRTASRMAFASARCVSMPGLLRYNEKFRDIARAMG